MRGQLHKALTDLCQLIAAVSEYLISAREAQWGAQETNLLDSARLKLEPGALPYRIDFWREANNLTFKVIESEA